MNKKIWSVISFLSLSTTLAWTIWLWPSQVNGVFRLSVFGWHVGFALQTVKLVIGVCSPGVIAVIWSLAEGKDTFLEMVSRLTNWKASFHWYVVAVLFPCGIYFGSFLLTVLLVRPTIHIPPVTNFFKVLLLTVLLGTLFEEVAWRWFALERLTSNFSVLISAIIVGGVWGVWHIPLWLVQFSFVTSYGILVYLSSVVSLIAWSVILAFVYYGSSRSLPVTILLHSTFNAASSQVALALPFSNRYVVYISSILSVSLSFAVVRVWKKNLPESMTVHFGDPTRTQPPPASQD